MQSNPVRIVWQGGNSDSDGVGVYLKQAGLFDAWVVDCLLSFTSPNAPQKRDLHSTFGTNMRGTVALSVLAGHRRYAHITALPAWAGEFAT